MVEDAQTPRIVGEDGLTNKERRKAKQEAKRKQVEEAKAPPKTQKRQFDEGDEGDAAAEDGEAGQDGEEVEVEALSHKEQRKRRKLEKKGLLPSAHDGEGAESGASGPSGKPQQPALPERSPHAVWIGNLSFQTNIERLQGWLEERNIKGISRVHMPRGLKKFEQNKGFAYVDLPSREAVELAVGLSEDHLDGRRLLIKSSSDYRGRPALDPTMAALAGPGTTPGVAASSSSAAAQASQEASAPAHIGGGKTGLTKTAQKILRAQRNPAGPTLFVGNLSFNSDEDGLRELFEASAMARDAWKKAEKGEKKKAKKVEKKKSSKKVKAEESSESDSDDDSDDESSDSSTSSSSENESEDSDEDESSDEEEDKSSVRGAGIRKVRMGTFEDSGKCKGFAFIDFHTPAHATASLVDLRNYRLDGRELKLEFAGADAVRRGALKGAAVNAAGGRGNWPSPHESGGAPAGKRRAAPEWRTKKGQERSRLAPSADSKHTKKKEKREMKVAARREAAAAAAASAAPVQGDGGEGGEGRKRHKETQAERQARREKAAASGGGAAGGKRAKPGAALANAQRGKTGIDTSGEAGKRTTFE